MSAAKDVIVVDLLPVAKELGLKLQQVENVVALADEGNTVPFITRYRKEATGNLDEQQIRAVLERVQSARQLADRAGTILRLIDGQGKLTPALKQAIEQADSLKRLEDLYLPYKPKKRTRAAMARERGLEPLADRIWNGEPGLTNLEQAARQFVAPDQELPGTAEVLAGAADILAERISEVAELRDKTRQFAWKTATLTTTAADPNAEGAQAFRDYFQHTEPVSKWPPHRILAINRGESTNLLKVKFSWDDPAALDLVNRHLNLSQHKFGTFLKQCAEDALGRLIQPSLEREIRRELTEKAERHAVTVFARNLRQLLLQPPLSGKKVLAIDPGLRTGCKVVVLDETGVKLLSDVVYVIGNPEKLAAARLRLAELLRQHDCTLVAIGNGTACRETEELVAQMIAEHLPQAQYVIVNEAGASIYSASAVAREEFPDDDATVRGTVSIGRRLQDPLSELVKIEPQHIGVGMYQHDVDQKELQTSLDQVVESCVNFVGVDLNRASASLLKYVSGLNQLTARRVVEYRQKHGAFRRREQLLKVGGIGPATFTQAAGFLKIRDGEEPLDLTWIHPESYDVARKLLKKLGVPADQPWDASSAEVRERLASLDVASLAQELGTGVLTLRDIIEALAKPGRDPRADLPGPVFKRGVLHLEDLSPGMELTGTVLNVVDFGAFVDVGLKESGLVHISQMSTQFVSSPHHIVAVGDVVTVWVLDVDQARKRVSLTMVKPGTAPAGRPRPQAAATAPATAAPATPKTSHGAATPASPRGEPATAKSQDLSAAQKQGQVPLRGFDQLKQLWTDKR